MCGAGSSAASIPGHGKAVVHLLTYKVCMRVLVLSDVRAKLMNQQCMFTCLYTETHMGRKSILITEQTECWDRRLIGTSASVSYRNSSSSSAL